MKNEVIKNHSLHSVNHNVFNHAIVLKLSSGCDNYEIAVRNKSKWHLHVVQQICIVIISMCTTMICPVDNLKATCFCC